MMQGRPEGGSDNLCSQCRDIDIEGLLLDRESPGIIQLRGYQEILTQADCALCRLVIRALSASSEDYWQRGHYPIEKCHLGRIEGTSSPLRLEVWFHATSSSLPKGISGHLTTVGEILPLDTFPLRASPAQCGVSRLLNSSAVDYNVVRGWIDDCRYHHGPSCHTTSRDVVDIMLIDVKRMRIVSSDSSQRYICLSYVWGGINVFPATNSSLPELRKDGSLTRLADQIPKTINDAIALVSSLGERYLWVDSLCIVQDDATSKREQIQHMGDIYNQAELTLVALSGNDANAGLPGVIKGSRHNQQVPETVRGLRLVAKLPELSASLNKSRWETRAWTFQEKVLSRKCLFFSNAQTYFQCRSGYCTEDCTRAQNRTDPGPGYSNPFERHITGSDEAYSSKFFMYESLVKNYSGRRHSYNSDSLNAFAGVLSFFKRSFGWEFINSLPEGVFDLALLWRPMTAISLRPRNAYGACTSPTWCWTSWIGDIFWDAWRMHSYAGAKVSLRTEVQQFIVTNGEGFHRIIRHQENLAHDRESKVLISEARAHLSGGDRKSSDSARGAKITSDMRLFFKASAASLSCFLISSRTKHTSGESTTISGWLKWQYATTTQIYDIEGRRCGRLHGLDPTWEVSYDSSNCEFIVLSRCGQNDIREADVGKSENSLPLEYPSSEDYYEQIFDTNCYKYTEWWAVNVMLIEWVGLIARRVAVGQIHAAAWTSVQSRDRLIALA